MGFDLEDQLIRRCKRFAATFEGIIEGRLGLTINRDKTRVVRLREPGARLDFLGYSFRYDRDQQGRPRTYLNFFPSARSLARARDRIRTLTSTRYSFVPAPKLVKRINRYLMGCAMYFRLGYPRVAFRHVNHFARQRLYRHLRRKSQRPYNPLRVSPGQRTWPI